MKLDFDRCISLELTQDVSGHDSIRDARSRKQRHLCGRIVRWLHVSAAKTGRKCDIATRAIGIDDHKI